MSGGNNDHTTAHKGGGEPDILDLEEPEALNVVIDGASPSDYPNEERRKPWRPRVLLAVSALVVVSVALGVTFGLTANKNSPPALSPSVKEFLSGLPYLELAENDTDSPQAMAMTWLENDPQYNEYELYRLNQRYVMAVLYYATNGTSSWDADRGWLSYDNECSWYQYEYNTSCMEASRLAMLSLFNNGLHGSIPTEVELLTDLEHFVFSDDLLSGTIHSEL
jgi:hypothetical protein